MPLSESIQAKLREHFPQLARLPAALWQRIVNEGEYREVPGGSVVFDEHAPCRGLPLILTGDLRVLQRGANGREVVLYDAQQGESCLLSASCLIGAIRYTATAVAKEPLEMVLLPATTFTALLDASPEFRRYLFAGFGARLGVLMQVVEAVVFQRLDQRLATRLLARGAQHVDATHQALADELGSVREIVTRMLRSFEEHGWVELGRERIVIRNRDALAKLAGGG